MFTTKTIQLEKYEKIILSNEETDEYVSIVPYLGGIISDLVLNKLGVNYNIIDSNDDYSGDRNNFYYKGSKLAPFPNRVLDGKYYFNGCNYQLPINNKSENHAIHGFVYDKQFSLVSLSANEHSAELEIEYSYEDAAGGFPFKFKLTLVYTLSKKGLRITTRAKNNGNQDMPYGDGWHPYFTFNEDVNNLSISIPSNKTICVDNRMIPTGEIKVDHVLQNMTVIGNRLFDTGFKIEDQDIATTQLYSPKVDVTINVWQESDPDSYSYLQIYIPPTRDSVAIEPMTCSTNAFNNGEGLIVISPNNEFKGEYGVFLS